MIRAFILAIALLSLSSCALFYGKEDLTPVAESVAKMQSMHLEMLGVVEGWVNNATGLSQEDKDKILNAIETDRRLFSGLAVSTIDTIKSLGDINWKDLAIKMLKEGKEVYNTFKENFGDLL